MSICELVKRDTGYNPKNEPVFQYSTTEPCASCGTTAETAVVRDMWDSDDETRLCAACYEARR